MIAIKWQALQYIHNIQGDSPYSLEIYGERKKKYWFKLLPDFNYFSNLF